MSEFPQSPAVAGLIFSTTPAGLLSDEDAAILNRDLPTLRANPDDYNLAGAKLNEYRAFRSIYPRPLTDEESRAKTDGYLKLEAVFEDFDAATAGQDLQTLKFAGPDELPALKQKLAVDGFLRLQLGRDEEGPDREIARDSLADRLFDGRGKGSDADFHKEASQWFAGRKAKRWLIDGKEGDDDESKAVNERSLTRNAVSAALAGENSAVAYMKWKEAAKPEGATEEELFSTWNTRFGAAAARVAPHLPALRKAFETLRAGMGVNDGTAEASVFGTVADAAGNLFGMSIEDFRAVGVPALRAMAEREAAGDKGRLQQTLEAFRRPLDNSAGASFDLLDWFGQNLTMATSGGQASRDSLAVGDAQRDIKTLLRAVADESVDPIRVISKSAAGATAEQALYDVSGSLGYMASLLVPGGWAASLAGYQDQNKAQLMLSHPDMSSADVEMISAAAAPVQSALDRLSLKMVAGRLPVLSGLLNRLAAPGGNAAARMALYGAGSVGTEYVAEQLQDASPLLMQEALAAVKQDVPDADWSGFEMMNPRTFWAVLPLALLGAGVNTIRDQRAARELVQDTDALRQFGLSPEAIARVQAAPDPVRALPAEWQNRTVPPAGPDWRAYEAQEAAVAATAQEQTAMQEAAGISIRRGADGWHVAVPADSIDVVFDSAGAAMGAARGMMTERAIIKEETFLDALDQFVSALPEGRTIEINNKRLTLLSEIEAATDAGRAGDVKAIWDRADQYLQGIGEAALARDIADPESRNALAGIQVLGKSVTEARENAARAISTVFRDGGTLDLIEEQAENDLRAAVAAGRVSMSTMRGIIARIEAATGDKYLFSDSETGVTEAWSSIVRLYSTATKKGSAATSAGRKETLKDLRIQRRRLRDAEAQGVAPSAFQKAREYFDQTRAVLGKAARLMKAKAAGKLDRIDDLIRESLGLVEQDAHNEAAAAEVQSMTDTAAPEAVSPREGSRAQPVDPGAPTTIMPDGSEIVGPTSFSIRAFHGSGARFDRFDLGMVGTGEGNQAFGWGLYFAENQEVGKSYQNGLTERELIRAVKEVYSDQDSPQDAEAAFNALKLSPDQRGLVDSLRRDDWLGFEYPHQAVQAAIREPDNFDLTQETKDALKSFGKLYTVDLLPDQGDFLDWDKPLSEQSEKVRELLRRAYEEQGANYPDKSSTPKTGQYVYYDFRALAGGLFTKDPAMASKYLASLGIPGIRYLDEGSRKRGSDNFKVLYDSTFTKAEVFDRADGKSMGVFDSFEAADAWIASQVPEPTSNYVIFDDSLIRILEVNGQPAGGAATSYSVGRVTPAQDAEYMDAVEAVDMEKARRMVDEAAKSAGFTIGPVWHGTPDGRFLKEDPVFKSQKARTGFGKDTGVHWFADSKKTAGTYADDRRAFDYQNAEPAVISAFLRLVNPLEIDGKGEQWRAAQRRGKTADAIMEAMASGNDGVIIRNVQDDYQTGAKGKTKPTTTYAAFESAAIKSADPVTRDGDGNVIPLSQRFNPASDSISYSVGPDPGKTWRVDGVQGDFASAADDAPWVPKSWQLVTIFDPTHPFDGSSIMVPIAGRELPLPDEVIREAVEKKRGQAVSFSVDRLRDQAERRIEFVSENRVRIAASLDAKIDKIVAGVDSAMPADALETYRPYLRRRLEWLRDRIRNGEVQPLDFSTRLLDGVDYFLPSGTHQIWAPEHWRIKRELSGILADVGFRQVPVRQAVGVLPLGVEESQTLPESNVSFALGPADRLNTIMERLDSRLARDPAARRALAKEANARLQALEFKWRSGTPMVDPRKKASLDREQRFREAMLTDEYEREAMAGLSDSAQAALGMTGDDVSAFGGPLAQRFTGGRFGTAGRIKGRAASMRESTGREADYDGAGGLPGMFFGGSLSPDQAAQEAYEAWEIKEPTPDALWDALRKELGTQARNREVMKDALSSLKETNREARARARDEAAAWRSERDAEQKRDHNPKTALLRDLRTLDAITAAFPPEIRARVGGMIQLAGLTTDAARLKELTARIEKLGDLTERYLQAETASALSDLIKRAMPEREAGKAPRGKLGAEGHRYFDAVAAVVDLSPDDIEARRAGIAAGMAKDDLTDAQALDLFEQEQILDAFGGFFHRIDGRHVKSAAEMDTAYRDALEVYDTNRNRWRTIEEARLAEVKGLAESVITALGKGGYRGTQAQKAAAAELAGKIKGVTLDMKSFTEVLDALFGDGSALSRRWSRRAREGFARRNDQLIALRRRWKEALEAATGLRGMEANRRLWDMGNVQSITVGLAGERATSTESVPVAVIDQWIAGTADPSALKITAAEAAALTAERQAMADADRRESLPLLRSTRVNAETAQLTEAEAVFITMLARQEQYADALDRAGWDDTALQAAEDGLSPAAKQLREFMAEEYRDGYAPLAAAFERMFGVALPQIRNYAPAAFYHQGAEREMDPTAGGGDQGGFRAGFLKNRKQHTAAPRLENAFATFFGHATQTAHWLGLAEMVREFTGVMNRPDVKRAIEARHGDATLKAVQNWAKSLEGNGLQVLAGQTEKAVGWLLRAQTYISLAYKMGTLMKQSSALLGAAYRMPLHDYARGFAKLLTGQLDARAIWNSPTIRRRLESGFAPEVRAAMNDLWSARPTRARAILDAGMEFIGLTDAIFTTGSAAIAYDYHLQRARAAGLTGAAAEGAAMAEVEDIVGRTAQPADMVDRSLFEQRLGAFGKLAFLFASEARQKSSMLLTAWGRTLTGQATAADARVLVIAHLIVGPAMQFITAAWRDARDDDDDELLDPANWDPLDFVKAAALGPFSGVPLIGEALSGFGGSGPLSRFVQGGKSAAAILEGPGESNKEPAEWYFDRVTRIMQATSAEIGVAGSVAGQVFDVIDNISDDGAEREAQRKRAERREKQERKADR